MNVNVQDAFPELSLNLTCLLLYAIVVPFQIPHQVICKKLKNNECFGISCVSYIMKSIVMLHIIVRLQIKQLSFHLLAPKAVTKKTMKTKITFVKIVIKDSQVSCSNIIPVISTVNNIRYFGYKFQWIILIILSRMYSRKRKSFSWSNWVGKCKQCWWTRINHCRKWISDCGERKKCGSGHIRVR